jgi:hypothetical protein
VADRPKEAKSASNARAGRKKNRLAKIFLFVALELGALAGVPMRPDQIEALLRTMNGQQLVHVVRDDQGDPPEPELEPELEKDP